QYIGGTGNTTFYILEIKDSAVELEAGANNVNWDNKIIMTETSGDAKLILPAADGGEPNIIDSSP
ncbi:hypothetical protein DRQ36_02635, partial [bacterium]